MKIILLSLITSLVALPANAREVCNHDPVCQAKRDGTTVQQAKKLDAAATARSRSGQALSYDRSHRAGCKMSGSC